MNIKEDLYVANWYEHNASTSSNFTRAKHMSKQNPAIGTRDLLIIQERTEAKWGSLRKQLKIHHIFFMFCLTSKIHQIIMNLNEEKSAP